MPLEKLLPGVGRRHQLIMTRLLQTHGEVHSMVVDFLKRAFAELRLRGKASKTVVT